MRVEGKMTYMVREWGERGTGVISTDEGDVSRGLRRMGP